MPYTHDNLYFDLTTPFGADVLLLRSFRGEEGLSELVRFLLEMQSETYDLDFTQVVGKGVTISTSPTAATAISTASSEPALWISTGCLVLIACGNSQEFSCGSEKRRRLGQHGFYCAGAGNNVEPIIGL